MRAKQKKKRTWLRVTGIVILLLLVAGAVYGYTVYKSLKDTVATMHQPVDRTSNKRPDPVALTKKQPFSVLMLGVDERQGDKGRSDTIIVLTVNPNQHSVKMLSIPRDTQTEIVGKGTVDKINHAYAFGSIPMAMDTVENFLDIPIDYYMKINMEGFKDIVDAVGGVTVQNNLDFTEGSYHFPVGEVTLNGDKALSFSRMRHQDPNGDFGREQRQRQIIQAILHKGANISSLANYNGILQAIGKNVKTNLTFDEMVDIQKNYKDATNNVEQIQVTGTGTMINKIYYLVISPEEKQKVQSELKAHLELNK
ncbi:LytR family transcriptional regulator [Bacillus sp. EB600]|uniref:polyisoprenyl-teichoic acid--peptidoglycan teichoic acid transferase TagU n=1 Tax=Bacillus sp. EB600 TaxID=2806345 RepID=UPI002108B71F|nr:LytR family transcriptional regulator [Bacillus sp. EB600]MCQ6278652.1 LytR family transcriptional regulator [Bacillus sp. EB600]